MALDVTALFEEAAYVWYSPELDQLVIRLVDQALDEERILWILVGKL